jgi:hypothetical protein
MANLIAFNKMARISLIATLCLVLQSCYVQQYWFMVTNTKSGNVCIDGFELASTDPYAQQVGKSIYARYGENEGEKVFYSSEDPDPYTISSGCELINSTTTPNANLIISVEFYKNVIEPEYLGIPPKPDPNTIF